MVQQKGNNGTAIKCHVVFFYNLISEHFKAKEILKSTRKKNNSPSSKPAQKLKNLYKKSGGGWGGPTPKPNYFQSQPCFQSQLCFHGISAWMDFNIVTTNFQLIIVGRVPCRNPISVLSPNGYSFPLTTQVSPAHFLQIRSSAAVSGSS